MGNSSGQTPTTQTANADPWSGVQGNLSDLYSRAGSLTGANVGYLPYQGALQAPVDPTLGRGLTQQAEIAKTYLGGTPGVNAARQLGLEQIQSRGLSPELKSLYEQAQGDENPYLQNILNTSNRQISNKVGSAMSGAGRYGSGQHADVAARAMAEAADPILAQDYARRQQQMQGIAEGGLQRSGQWGQLMPTLDEAQYAPAQKLQEVGQFYQGRANQDVANQVAIWNANQSRDWENLQRYASILSGAGGIGGTKVTTTTPAQASTLQRVLGGGLAGAGLGGSFGGPIGAGAGALGGGLLGMM